MTVTEPHTSMNGVIKIQRRGIVKIEFDAADGPIGLDVIAVYDQWSEIDWQLRDKDGVLPNDKADEYGQNRLNFVQAVVNDGYAAIGKAAPLLTRAEAFAFIEAIREEAKKLLNFTSPKKETPSSPQENTDARINFSQ